MILYQATVNQYAPLGVGSFIINTATISGPGLTNDIEVSEQISAENTAASAADNVVITDTFNPVLDPISVTFNGTTWTTNPGVSTLTVTGTV